jgi:hypothetical protein
MNFVGHLRGPIYVANLVPKQAQVFVYISGKTYMCIEFLRKPASALHISSS